MTQKNERISPGYQIGELTIIRATKEKKNRCTIWLCRCSCGNEILLDTRHIQRKTKTDCGCITKIKAGRRDLTNMRFGKLVCIEPSDEKVVTNQTSWLCKCDCGNTCLAGTNQLISGYKKSCGCMSHPPLKNFIGLKFGKLTVVEYSGKKAGLHRWKCICECGNETVVGQTLLQTGKTQSCGCIVGEGLIERRKYHNGTSIAALEWHMNNLQKSNTSGYTGVYQIKKTGKWNAQITFKGKTQYLGSFIHKEDAIKARQKAEEELHKNFIREYYQEEINS